MNDGLKALTTTDELREVEVAVRRDDKFFAPNHDPNCTKQHTVLRYAFEQKWPGMPSVRYWHVLSEGRSHHSTLSLEGLKQWGLIQ